MWLAIFLIVLFPISLVLMLIPFIKTVSLINKIFCGLIGVALLNVVFQMIYNYFKSKKIGPKYRVILTTHSIVGPSDGAEAEIKWDEIKTFKIEKNLFGKIMILQSSSKTIRLAESCLNAQDFVSIQNAVASAKELLASKK